MAKQRVVSERHIPNGGRHNMPASATRQRVIKLYAALLTPLVESHLYAPSREGSLSSKLRAARPAGNTLDSVPDGESSTSSHRAEVKICRRVCNAIVWVRRVGLE
ncbi:hypothetical protein PM082_007824 [Marasmius tenuissimus]|nr:hypothetical protein PM082_007824 [Marasmius tenuissimus]